MDISISSVWIIVFFDEDFKYGDGAVEAILTQTLNQSDIFVDYLNC
jgi:hypothetical protein